jgi:hypothetical protein
VSGCAPIRPLSLLLVDLTLVLGYRYLKFFRQYSFEVLVAYAADRSREVA